VVSLSLPNNNVQGDFTALHRLTALDEVILDSNKMTWGNNIFFAPRLRTLSCKNCELQGNIPSNIANLRTLLTLSLGYNQLSGSLPVEIYSLSNLQNLYLNNNQLQNSLNNTRIGGWQNLRNLDLSHNQLNDRLPQNLGTLFQLRTLNLSHNQFAFLVPTTLKDLYYLEKFDVSYNFFEGGVNTIFVNMPALAYVDISHNQFNGLLAGIFSGLSNLRYVDVSFNNFKEFFSGNDLFNATQLTYLNTSNNPQMIGDLPSSIGNAVSLRYLNLAKALLSSKLPNSLANLRQLEVLKLDSNRFEGEVPAEIDSLKNLKELYLASNRLSRFPVVSQLKKLERLSLERNQLGFESLETNWKLARQTTYIPQDSLLLTDNCEMRMPTGGTANTYFWYENGSLLPTAKAATLRPTARNVYRAEVRNTLVPNLTLYSRPLTPTFIPPTTRLVRDTLITCNPVNMVLDGGIADSYRWSTGDSTRTIRVTKSGIYKIRTVRSICVVEDSIRIRYRGVKENDIRGEQQICKNTIPKRIEGITEVFSIRPRFQWQFSSNLQNWKNADTSTFIQPAALSQTTYYRRIAKAVICEADTSNIIKITVSDTKITAQVQNNLCANESKGSIALQLAGGIAPYRTAWQDN
ncbi:MAG: leucine-rich repeat domain-containing protein, partial [Thermoflexibacteraceae bacterium]